MSDKSDNEKIFLIGGENVKYDTKLSGTLTKAEKEQILDLIRYFQSKEYTVNEALHTMSEARDQGSLDSMEYSTESVQNDIMYLGMR